MKNINVRVEDWLKERVEEIAQDKKISVTELVTESLKYGLDPAVVALRLPEATAAQLRQAAEDEGMEFDKFVEGVLRIYLQEPWSAWKATPASVDKRRKLAQSRQVFEEGRNLALEMLQRQKEKGTEFDLRLMWSLEDVSGIPTTGKNLMVVAVIKDVLRFRIFDGDGKAVVDTDETRLMKQAKRIEDLRKQLESLGPHHKLAGSDKDRVITAVTSIVGHTPGLCLEICATVPRRFISATALN